MEIIESKIADLGEFTVRRTLPSAKRKLVGPFVFFDHMGPAEFQPGTGVAVRPHPHIGIATVTYLFDGEIIHRDSLGYEQPIQTGAVNWMVAGRGIVHSERTRPENFESGSTLHGIQSWIALPLAEEERAPSFSHHPAESLPEKTTNGAVIRLIAGSALGMESDVATYSPMYYLDIQAETGADCPVPSGYTERAVYVVSGQVGIGGERVMPGEMAVIPAGDNPLLEIPETTRFMQLGGDALEGKRYVWWNFVSSSKDRIEQAKRDWKEGRFEQVPGETEFIPLPD